RRAGPAVLLSLALAAPVSALALQVFQESAGVVTMEAEHATARISAVSRDWLDVASASASGGTAIQASPDGGVYSNTTNSPRAAFQVNFTQTGVYYLWVRLTGPSSSSDSAHVGYKSVMLTTATGGGLTSGSSSGYVWDNTEGSSRITFNVASPGIHSVDLWMREDGVIVDKLVATQNAAFIPADTGPAESERVERPVISSAASAAGTAGTLFNYRITAPQPVDSYSATGLPAGLAVVPSTGEIEGRPTQTGTFSATITATNRGGSDTNALTITVAAAPAAIPTTTAFKTALGAAVPGDVIILANGTYTNFGYYKMIKSGTAAQPVTVRAQTPGGVIFNGNVQFEIQANYVVLDGFRFNGDARPSPDYVNPPKSSGLLKIRGTDNRISECTINAFNRVNATDNATKWIQLKGDRHRVDHCHFAGKVGQGQIIDIELDGTADYHRIDHNEFRNFTYGGDGTNEYESVRVGVGTLAISTNAFSTVEDNFFENCDGELETISVKSSDNVIRRNTLLNCRGSITLRQGKRNLVEGNTILNLNGRTELGGIRVCGTDHEIIDNYVQGARTGSSTHIGGVVLMSSDYHPATAESTMLAEDHWPVKAVTVQNNSLINCKQSFVYGGGNYGFPPESAAFIDNCARNNLAGNGQFDFVRVVTPSTAPSPAYTPAYTYDGERYYGSALGFTPTPAGIDTAADPALVATAVNGYTLYFAPSGAGTAATRIAPLTASNAGPLGYAP
ncbi:MAG TPA: chondroitinase-B domain-containing protein, partial [Rariglobus sp.]|nr:chondroitinase-B domain-containing protein [Rariglobus sp.]